MRGADVHAATTDGGVTALMWACMNDDIETVRALLDHGANPAAFALTGETALIYASKCGRRPVVQELLMRGVGVNVAQAESGFGKTPLMYACDKNFLEIVGELIERGANVNAERTGDRAGETALTCTSYWGHWDVLYKLLDSGAVINPDHDITALMYACQRGDLHEVRELFAQGWRESSIHACAAIETEASFTSLMLACWRGHLETVRELLQQGAQVNAGDMPALLWASRSGHFEVVRQLLGSGADVNAARRHNGCTALMEASRAGRTEVACLLLAHGASRAAVDFSGRTAFDQAPEACADLREVLALP